jgi:uncharacterized membrane-anchored protein YitT (DUF2179 family)
VNPWPILGRILRRGTGLVIGNLVVAVALEIFLVPNQIIDGGVVGLSIMAAHLTGRATGLFLLLLNLPFLWMGYKQIGKSFAICTLSGVVMLALFTAALHPLSRLTSDLLLAAVFGGLLLGLGVGTIIRSGGSLDGTEVVAIALSRRLPFSVGEIVLFFNLFIFGSAAFVFGWDRALYSLLTYFVAFRAIDLAVQGLEESKSVVIVTDQPDPIREAILHRLGRGVTELEGRGGLTREPKAVLLCIITRLELAKLKAMVQEADPGAFLFVEDVHEVLGGRWGKHPSH